jgi:hypothetical protein
VVRRPLLLLSALDEDGQPVAVSSADLLDITAPELTGPSAVRWQVDGYPQPFGKPGESIIGSQCNLRRVDD